MADLGQGCATAGPSSTIRCMEWNPGSCGCASGLVGFGSCARQRGRPDPAKRRLSVVWAVRAQRSKLGSAWPWPPFPPLLRVSQMAEAAVEEEHGKWAPDRLDGHVMGSVGFFFLILIFYLINQGVQQNRLKNTSFTMTFHPRHLRKMPRLINFSCLD